MIKVKISGDISRVGQKVDEIDARSQALLLQYALAMKTILAKNLESKLGSKFKHLAVTVSGTGGRTITVTIGPKDQVGGYLMSGTKPHIIRSTKPMPIADGQFRYVVHHPGTEGLMNDIQMAILATEAEAKTALGGIGNRLVA